MGTAGVARPVIGGCVRVLDRLLEALPMARQWWQGAGRLAPSLPRARVTQDVDIVVPAGLVDALIRAASVGGFEVPPRGVGMWPSFRRKESDIRVDLLPEGNTGAVRKAGPHDDPASVPLGGPAGARRLH